MVYYKNVCSSIRLRLATPLVTVNCGIEFHYLNSINKFQYVAITECLQSHKSRLGPLNLNQQCFTKQLKWYTKATPNESVVSHLLPVSYFSYRTDDDNYHYFVKNVIISIISCPTMTFCFAILLRMSGSSASSGCFCVTPAASLKIEFSTKLVHYCHFPNCNNNKFPPALHQIFKHLDRKLHSHLA